MVGGNPERHVATFGQTRVLFVMATEHEYGPHLKRQIVPLITGVGPVEAAVETAAALAALAANGRLPHWVVSLGSAGSRTLDHAGLYQISAVSYRDMDATALGFARGQTPFLDLPIVVEIPHRVPGIAAASIATGASIVASAGYNGIAADMVDMETFAVLRAADRFDLPMIGLRGISDGRAEVTGLHHWTEYLHIIDEKLAVAVERIAALATEGLLQPG